METSHKPTSELLPAKGLYPLKAFPQGWRNALREGNRVYVDGVYVGDLSAEEFVLRTDISGAGVAELPAPVRQLLAEDRDGILIKLIFASRRLAEAQLRIINPSSLGCLECREVSGLPLHHAQNCLTGHVLDLLDQLCDVSAPGLRKLHEEIAPWPA
jgi:hypothetical protein